LILDRPAGLSLVVRPQIFIIVKILFLEFPWTLREIIFEMWERKKKGKVAAPDQRWTIS